MAWLLANVFDVKIPDYHHARTQATDVQLLVLVPRTYHADGMLLAARHEQVGEAHGAGRAVILVLEARGVSVPAALREQILACTDLAQLDAWLRRAVTATTADDVVRG